MEKYQKIFISVMLFIATFITTIIISELAAHFLTLPNTIANIFGGVILFITFAFILIIGYLISKFLNK
jgi:hypothetical protein